MQNQLLADRALGKTETSAPKLNASCVLFFFTLPVFDVAELAKTLTTRFEFSWVRVCGILWDMCSGALPPERCCCEPVSRPRAVYQHQPSCPPCGADIQARRTTLDQSFSVAMENLTFFFTKPVFAPFIRNDYN